MYKGNAAYVVVDAAAPERIAVSTEDTVLLSANHGAAWAKLDSRLLARVNCPLSFAGERLLVGSGGSGAFWIALPSALPSAKLPCRPTRVIQQANTPKIDSKISSDFESAGDDWLEHFLS